MSRHKPCQHNVLIVIELEGKRVPLGEVTYCEALELTWNFPDLEIDELT